MSLSLCTSACAGMPRVSAAHLSLLRRCFASSFHKETFGGVVPKPKEDMLKKRDDPTMVQVRYSVFHNLKSLSFMTISDLGFARNAQSARRSSLD